MLSDRGTRRPRQGAVIEVKAAMEVARWFTVAGVLQPPATRALVRPVSVTKMRGVQCSG